MTGSHKHQTGDAKQALRKMLAGAMGPVAPLVSEGDDVTSQRAKEVMIGLFAVAIGAMSVVIYNKATKFPWIAAVPLLISAFMLASLVSYHRTMGRIRGATAETLLGPGQDNVVNALHQFQAETLVPVRIIIRDTIPNLSVNARLLFTQCEREGKLDSRGVLFVLSAKTGGYALVLGQALARSTPDIMPVWVHLTAFGQGRYEAGLIDSLQALRPQLAQRFPRTQPATRPAAEALDIRRGSLQ
jgi:hypothetical protein